MAAPRTPKTPRLLLLHPDDAAAVLTAAACRGDTVRLDERCFVLDRDLGLGHKVAIRSIAAGEVVCKYGFPIGTATRPIAPGEHVHRHNLVSNALPARPTDNPDA